MLSSPDWKLTLVTNPEYPCSAQPQSILKLHNRKVSLQCPIAEYPCHVQPHERKLFISSIPTLKPLLKRSVTFPCPPSLQHCKCAARILILCCWALQGYSAVGHWRDTFRLGPAGIFGGWTLQGYSAIGHCRDTLQLGTAGILCGWALHAYFVAEHCKDALRLGNLRILCGWALQGYSAVGLGHCRDTLRLGTAGILCGWALQGYLGWALQGHSAVGHCRDTLRLGTAWIFGGWSPESASSRARTTSILRSSNPTARVGKKTNEHQEQINA